MLYTMFKIIFILPMVKSITTTPENLFTELDIDHNTIITKGKICPIPLTHSFKKTHISNPTQDLLQRSHAAFKKPIKEIHTEYNDLQSAYQRGRNAALDDMAETVIAFVAIDAGLSLFEDILEMKNY